MKDAENQPGRKHWHCCENESLVWNSPRFIEMKNFRINFFRRRRHRGRNGNSEEEEEMPKRTMELRIRNEIEPTVIDS